MPIEATIKSILNQIYFHINRNAYELIKRFPIQQPYSKLSSVLEQPQLPHETEPSPVSADLNPCDQRKSQSEKSTSTELDLPESGWQEKPKPGEFPDQDRPLAAELRSVHAMRDLVPRLARAVRLRVPLHQQKEHQNSNWGQDHPRGKRCRVCVHEHRSRGN